MTLIIKHRNLTWLEHAEKHFYAGYSIKRDHFSRRMVECLNSADEHLMYICLFAYYGE